MSIDKYDKLILEALQKDGRISNVQLAQQVSLSYPSTYLFRSACTVR